MQLETNEFVRGEPKTAAGVRSITISGVTAEVLTGHLERYSVPGPDGLVFPNAAGHSSINVTLDRYGHLFPELDEAIADAFDRQIIEARRRLDDTVVHAAFGVR